jgi:Domain of unknown function (DUF5916)
LKGFHPGKLGVQPHFYRKPQRNRPDLNAEDFESEAQTDAGLSALWGIAPNWTVNAALDPDFSNVEADVAQLNVNRQFALFSRREDHFFLKEQIFLKHDCVSSLRET